MIRRCTLVLGLLMLLAPFAHAGKKAGQPPATSPDSNPAEEFSSEDRDVIAQLELLELLEMLEDLETVTAMEETQ